MPLGKQESSKVKAQSWKALPVFVAIYCNGEFQNCNLSVILVMTHTEPRRKKALSLTEAQRAQRLLLNRKTLRTRRRVFVGFVVIEQVFKSIHFLPLVLNSR